MSKQKGILSFFKPVAAKRLADKNGPSDSKRFKNCHDEELTSHVKEKLTKQLQDLPVLDVNMGESWYFALENEFKKPYFKKLSDFVNNDRENFKVYPAREDVWAWTKHCTLNEVKVVIIGQDPYHNPRQAHGLCFSVQKGIRPPPSLVNIYKELTTDIPEFKSPSHGDLTNWARQGVLLLNACLTVRENSPNSHSDKGWENITDAAIKAVSDANRDVVFLLWGAFAQKKASCVDKLNILNIGVHALMEQSPEVLSIVQYLSSGDATNCGYCKSRKGSTQNGLWAFKLSVEDYQALIDRGWRRSGHYCYKPIMHTTCCPMYTIRCNARDFKLSKSQKRILKKMNSYLESGDKGKTRQVSSGGDEFCGLELNHVGGLPAMSMDEKQQLAVTQAFKNADRKILPSHKREEAPKAVELADVPSKPDIRTPQRPLKAKQIRIKRKREKLMAKGLTDEEISKKMIEKKRYPVAKNLEDFIDAPSLENSANRLKLRLVRSSPRSPEFINTYEEGYSLFKKYQMSIHKDPADKTSKSSYDRFLVDSPLQEDGEYGSFHQQYWLDGKLIAVGVMDILPYCISSVYLFYDPDFSFLGLGTYSALRELHLVRSLEIRHPKLAYYYMGYYIRSCPKMRYKGAFKPSFLLCPEVYSWHPIEKSLPKIDLHKSSRLNDDSTARDLDRSDEAIDDVPLIYENRLDVIRALPTLRSSTRNIIKEYCDLVGSNCARRMILQLR